MCLKPVHFAANLLNPKIRGKHLNEDERCLAVEYINTLAGKMFNQEEKHLVMANLAEYQSETGNFEKK